MKKYIVPLLLSLSLVSLTSCANQVIDRGAAIDPARVSVLEQKYSLPPDPGQLGKEDIAGVDSDKDGIRDDVQRKIYFWLADNKISQEYPKLVPMMLDFAKAKSKFMVAESNHDVALAKKDMFYFSDCISVYARIADSRRARQKYGKKRLSNIDTISDRSNYLDELVNLVSAEFIDTKPRLFAESSQYNKYGDYRSSNDYNHRWCS